MFIPLSGMKIDFDLQVRATLFLNPDIPTLDKKICEIKETAKNPRFYNLVWVLH